MGINRKEGKVVVVGLVVGGFGFSILCLFEGEFSFDFLFTQIFKLCFIFS